MDELLKRAGFRLRKRGSARASGRADCAHCKGRSTGTVSYTPTVAYCHRCGWRSSKARLEYQLNPRKFPSSRKKPAASDSAARAQAMAAAFRAWVDQTLHAIAIREKQIYWAKRRASACIAQRMDDPSAWDALIALSQEEDWLDQLWDFLTRERNSRWWNPPITEEEVFRCWRDVQAVVSTAPAPLR